MNDQPMGYITIPGKRPGENEQLSKSLRSKVPDLVSVRDVCA